MNPFERRLLFGHRGAPAHCRENTMASFTRALADGANALETDAHLSRDGHVMLVHDPELERVFQERGLVNERSRGQLEALGIPALEDALAHFAVPFNIDVKQRTPRMEEAIVAAVERAGAAARVLLTSFHDDVVRRVRATGYTGPTGLAYREIARLLMLPRALLKLAPPRGARAQVPVRSGRAHFATRSFIDKAHAVGIAVDFWVVNDITEARHLLELGADGLMSDDPGVLAPAFGPQP